MLNMKLDKKTNKAFSTVVALFSSTILGFIFILMDGITYGRLILPSDNSSNQNENLLLQNISMFIFLGSTFLAQLTFGLTTSIKSGILSGFIVETLQYYKSIFNRTYNKLNIPDAQINLPTVITNTLFCTSLSTFLFGLISLCLCFFDIGKYLVYIPKSALTGSFGAIGILQFDAAFRELKINSFSSIFSSTQTWTILLIVIIISLIGVALQEKYSNISVLIPLYTIILCCIFYFYKYVFNYSIEDLRAKKLLLQNENGILGINLILDNFKFNLIEFQYVYDNLGDIIKLALFNLIQLPVNISTYCLDTGLKATFKDELKAQAIGNFVSALCFGPSYFICSNSIFFRRSGGKSKWASIITGFSIIILFFIGKTIKSYTPTILLAYFPFFIGLSICYSSFVNSFMKLRKTNNLNDYCVLVITAIVGVKLGIVEGIVIGTILNMCAYMKYNYSHIKNKFVKEVDGESVNKVISNTIIVDYILFFGTIKYLLVQIDSCVEKNVKERIVIDMQNCKSVDWLALDMLTDKIEEMGSEFLIVGSPVNFYVEEKENLKWYKNINEFQAEIGFDC